MRWRPLINLVLVFCFVLINFYGCKEQDRVSFNKTKQLIKKKSLRCFKVSSDGDLLLRNYLETRKSIQFILRKITTAVAFRLYIVRQIPTLILFLSEDVFLCLLFIITVRERARNLLVSMIIPPTHFCVIWGCSVI